VSSYGTAGNEPTDADEVVTTPTWSRSRPGKTRQHWDIIGRTVCDPPCSSVGSDPPGRGARSSSHALKRMDQRIGRRRERCTASVPRPPAATDTGNKVDYLRTLLIQFRGRGPDVAGESCPGPQFSTTCKTHQHGGRGGRRGPGSHGTRKLSPVGGEHGRSAGGPAAGRPVRGGRWCTRTAAVVAEQVTSTTADASFETRPWAG